MVDLDARSPAAVAEQRLRSVGEPPRIEVGQLPAVYADAAMVRQLMDNLVGNAVKYVVPGEVPEVSVTGGSDGPASR